MTRTRIFFALVVALVLAACGDLGRDVMGPGSPSLDSGPVIGGNRSDSTTTTTSTVAPDTARDDSGPVIGGN